MNIHFNSPIKKTNQVVRCDLVKYIFFSLSVRLILLFVAIIALSLSEHCCYISHFFFSIDIANMEIQIKEKDVDINNIRLLLLFILLLIGISLFDM